MLARRRPSIESAAQQGVLRGEHGVWSNMYGLRNIANLECCRAFSFPFWTMAKRILTSWRLEGPKVLILREWGSSSL